MKERLSPRRRAGVAIALTGVWIVMSHGEVRSLASAGVGLGEVFRLAAVTSWAFYSVIGRKILAGLSPIAATRCAAPSGTLMLGRVASREFDTVTRVKFSWQMIAASLYLGVGGTALAFIWYYTSIKKP